MLVAVAGVFDLACTVSAYEKGWLVELNPLAALALDCGGTAGLALYRFTLTVMGCVLLSWGLRAYHARRFIDSPYERLRIGAVVFGTQTATVAAHFALVGWWVAWFAAAY